jgi:putative acetyltransferase
LIKVREERPEDIEAIRVINQDAFGQSQEGQIVDALRANAAVLLSMVAALDGCVIGHILYSPVFIDSGGKKVIGAGLGPMAVLPRYQRQGVGRKLIESGNNRLRQAGCPFIVVLGHPDYYPRFGFKPASAYGIRCEWDVPDDVFMAIIMDHLKMEGVSGLAKYRREFAEGA